MSKTAGVNSVTRGKNKNTSLKELQSWNSVSALSKTQFYFCSVHALALFLSGFHRFWCILHFCREGKGSSSWLQTAKPFCARTKILHWPKKKKPKPFFAWLKAAGQAFKHQYSSTGTHISGPLNRVQWLVWVRPAQINPEIIFSHAITALYLIKKKDGK